MHHCEQWEVMGLVPWQTSVKLKKAIGLTQHHDAVTGTEREHVVEDYQVRLKNATEKCENMVNGSKIPDAVKKSEKITVYNSLAWDRTEMVHVPGKGSFEMDLPALGFLEIEPNSFKKPEEQDSDNHNFVIKNQFHELHFNPKTHVIKIDNKHEFLHEFRYYKASPGGSSFEHNPQASGAYIFQPVENTPNIYVNVTAYKKLSNTEMLVETDKPEKLTYSWQLELDKIVMKYAKSR